MKAPEVSKCRSCGAAIIWIDAVCMHCQGQGTVDGPPCPRCKGKKAKRLPVNRTRVVLYRKLDREGLRATDYRKADEWAEFALGWISHFLTCPDAASWGKRPSREEQHDPDGGNK